MIPVVLAALVEHMIHIFVQEHRRNIIDRLDVRHSSCRTAGHIANDVINWHERLLRAGLARVGFRSPQPGSEPEEKHDSQMLHRWFRIRALC